MAIRDILIVGAGPSGLAAAIAAKKRGLDYHIVEQGVLVNSIFHFPPQMVFFTTPELLEIGGLPLTSPNSKPTRAEALTYYRRVVDTYGLQINFGEKVVAIEREGQEGQEGQEGRKGHKRSADHFVIQTRSREGVTRVREARFVVMAIGYYDHPAMLGVPGEDRPHVHHYYGEAHAHYRERVVVVGGGNSAAEAALELYRAGAHVTIVHRRPTLKPTIKYWVRPDIENRIKEGSIAARFGMLITEIRPKSIVIAPFGERDVAAEQAQMQRETAADRDAATRLAGAARVSDAPGPAPSSSEEIPADTVYLLTGYRADSDLLCRAGVRLNDRQAPEHDKTTFETNVPNLFVAGGAIAGMDTGTVFIENGRFHGEKIVEEIARRLET